MKSYSKFGSGNKVTPNHIQGRADEESLAEIMAAHLEYEEWCIHHSDPDISIVEGPAIKKSNKRNCQERDRKLQEEANRIAREFKQTGKVYYKSSIAKIIYKSGKFNLTYERILRIIEKPKLDE